MLTTWAPYDSLSLFQNNIANTHEEPGSTEIKALFFYSCLDSWFPLLFVESGQTSGVHSSAQNTKNSKMMVMKGDDWSCDCVCCDFFHRERSMGLSLHRSRCTFFTKSNYSVTTTSPTLTRRPQVEHTTWISSVGFFFFFKLTRETS